MKILVVDDDPIQRRLLQGVLEKAGKEIVLANDGRTAWELIRRDHIRMVISDWMMPGMDGAQLIHKIRSSDLPGYVYVILLTAKGSNEDIVAGLQAGADDYLVKPCNPYELRARVAVGERILALEDRLLQARDQLERLAMCDSLTSLLNRRALYRLARGELERAQRSGEPLSVVFLDIDRFKQINDEYGHVIGDEVLKMVAVALQENSRPYDVVGRWAGDEFLVFLPGVDAKNAEKVARRILDAITSLRLPLPDGRILSVQASAGVSSTASVDDPDSTLDRLVRQADQAMYRSKDAGGGKVTSG